MTDVVISHHHPDHTWHVGLFPAARLHDHWAVYRADQWDDQPAEGRQVSPNVRLIETPGHTPQDVSTLVTTDAGLVVCTHLWGTPAAAGGPARDGPLRPARGPRARPRARPGDRRPGPRPGLRPGRRHAALTRITPPKPPCTP